MRKNTDAPLSGGAAGGSDEGPVMGLERTSGVVPTGQASQAGNGEEVARSVKPFGIAKRASPCCEIRSLLISDGGPIVIGTCGDASKPPVFLGPHFYASHIPGNADYQQAWIESLTQNFFLVVADYPRGIGRTRDPHGISFNPAILAKDYTQVADLLGLGRFAYVGYSFGAAVGIQLACRTDRISALLIGGFPPLDAPYTALRQLSEAAAQLPDLKREGVDAGVLWSAVGFYAALEDWPERTEVPSLKMPRLLFLGDDDRAQGATRSLPIADIVRDTERELKSLGWQVHWLSGHDHSSAMQPDVALPIVREFLLGTVAGG
jgi:pimeloyl-ACP methyl ester carboxylesterase